MNTELILDIDTATVEQADKYAKANRIGIKKKAKPAISPLIKSLTGVIPSESADGYKKAYLDYLSEKYS
ncbi:hypothetical protein Barb6_02145 [Bacteroidales bacterium Barb6]|nr:hypothetical protein Barb6_02145 [Bacteroidales bacterium Barb6]